MKAAFLTGLRTVEVRDVPEPALRSETDVRVHVDVVGVCGSDMHYYRTGRIGEQVVTFPWIVGHEFAGTVESVGSGVTDLAPGRRVAVDPLIACGRCDQCLAGREHTCRDQRFMGCPGQEPGCLAELVVVPRRCCYDVPARILRNAAALVEPFSIGLYAQQLAGEVRGKTAAVLGSGPIGLCVILALKQAGAARIYATDLLDERLALARRLGADWVASPREQDVVAEISSAEPLGVDFAWECAGQQETLDQCVNLLTPGGEVLVVGIPEFDRWSFLADSFRRKEIRVQNVRRQNGCMQAAIDLVASGAVDVAPLATHELPLARCQEAFDLVADYCDGAVKVMIHL